MKRYSVIRLYLKTILSDEDIAIFTGSDMCKEAYCYDRPGNLYIEDDFGLAVSYALGLAMTVKNRVVVFTGEGDFLRELGVGIQAAASRCRNLHIVLLDNLTYNHAGKMPNLFSNMNSKKAMLSSFGLFLHDYTPYFKDKNAKGVLTFYDDIKGPLAIYIEVEPGTKSKLPKIDVPKDVLLTKFMGFTKAGVTDIKKFMDEDAPMLALNEQVVFGGN